MHFMRSAGRHGVVAAALALAACADVNRAPLVTSQAWDVDVPAMRPGTVVVLEPFAYPGSGTKVDQTRTAVNRYGVPIASVTYTYEFDQVDRDNLRASLVSSLEKAGAVVKQDTGDAPVVPSAGEIVVKVRFERIGTGLSATHVMAKDVTCVFDGEVVLQKDGVVSRHPMAISGDSLWTVAGSKHKAMELFVQQLAAEIRDMH